MLGIDTPCCRLLRHRLAVLVAAIQIWIPVALAREANAAEAAAGSTAQQVEVSTKGKAPSDAGRLASHWRRQQEEIGTAEIQFRLLRLSADRLAPLSSDDVNKLLTAANLDDHPEDFAVTAVKMLVPEVAADLFPPDTLAALLSGKPPWRGEFYSNGFKRREQTWDNVHIFDGEVDMRHNAANHQIDAYVESRSSMKLMSLADFRLRCESGSLASWKSETLPNGKVLFSQDAENSRMELVADPATGFIVREMTVSGKPPAAQSRREEFQFAPKKYPGGINFPRLRIGTVYSSGRLQRIDMVKIDEARFNECLVDDKFILAAKAGTNVFVRYGDPAKEPVFLPIAKDIANVAEFIRTGLDSAEVHFSRATSWLEQGKYDRAVEEYTAAIRVDAKFVPAVNGLAWLRATCPQADLRDGKQAVELATKSCELTHWKDFYLLDSLAAAYAEQGNFAEAAKQQAKALDLAAGKIQTDELGERLELYKSNKPFREVEK